MKSSKDVRLRILKMVAINSDFNNTAGNVIRSLANLRATYGVFLIGKEPNNESKLYGQRS